MIEKYEGSRSPVIQEIVGDFRLLEVLMEKEQECIIELPEDVSQRLMDYLMALPTDEVRVDPV